MAENKVIKTMDPRLDLTRGSKMVLEEGPRLNSLVKRSSSRANNSGITFDNIDPGSPGFVIDRKMYFRIGYNISLNPRNGDDTRLDINTDTLDNARESFDLLLGVLGINVTNGFRAFPIAQSTRTLELVLNGETFTERLNDYVEPLLRYDNDYIRAKGDYSLTPGLQDNAFDPKLYFGPRLGGNLDPGTNPVLALAGSKFSVDNNSNVFKSYGGMENIIPRGAFIGGILPATVAVAAAPGNGRYIGAFDFGGVILNMVDSGTDDVSRLDSVTIVGTSQDPNITCVEPIMLPITVFGEPECRGFYGVNDMTISLVFDSSLTDRVYEGTPVRFNFDAAAGPAVAGFTNDVENLSLGPAVTIASGDLYYNRLTPKITPELPPSNLYDDKRIKITDKVFNVNFAADSLETRGIAQTFNNVSVGTVPKRIYIYARKSNKDYRDSDFYARINSFTFDFNNQNVQFSGADSEQLYLMCKRNGLLMEYKQWDLYSGSVLCIDFARDVSLNDGDYPGRIGNYNFSFTINLDVRRGIIDAPAGVIAPAENNVQHLLRTVVIEEGYAIVQNQICSRVGGLIQVDPTSVPLRVASKDQYWENIYGGKFIDDLKHVAHKGLKMAEKALPYAQKIGEKVVKYGPGVAKGIATVLPLLAAGAGMSEKEAKRLVDTYGVEEFMKMYGGSVEAGKMSLKKKAKGGKETSKAEMSKYL